MYFAFRNAAALVSLGILILCSSCEKHELGEFPPAQREHSELAKASAVDPDSIQERTEASPAPTPKPTPAEFFPEGTPR
jgi:hypothetical protein